MTRPQEFLKSCDVGSMPGKYSPEAVLKGYADKKNAGIDIPNYPQLRDMNEMFLELANCLERCVHSKHA